MAFADPINRAVRRVPPWLLYIGTALYAAWLFWLGLTGGLGVEPINALEREYGEAALWLLVAGLAVTPLRRLAGVNLMRHRRAIGVSCFALVVAHFSVWALLDVQSVGRVWADIVKRPYITVGMLALLMLIPLGLTSNNLSVRRMGAAAWGRLHRLVYPAALLAGLHSLWIAKGFELRPVLFMGAILLLLALRIRPGKRVGRLRQA